MNWDPEKKFKVEEDNLLNLRTGYPLYLQTTHKRPFMLERSNVGQCHELKFPTSHHMSHLCGYWIMIWPIWGLGGAISLLYTYSHVCTWPSIVLNVQIFISLGLCLLPSKKLNFLGNFSGKDAILCRVSGPAAHNCPCSVMGFQVTTLGVFFFFIRILDFWGLTGQSLKQLTDRWWMHGSLEHITQCLGHIFGCCSPKPLWQIRNTSEMLSFMFLPNLRGRVAIAPELASSMGLPGLEGKFLLTAGVLIFMMCFGPQPFNSSKRKLLFFSPLRFPLRYH